MLGPYSHPIFQISNFDKKGWPIGSKLHVGIGVSRLKNACPDVADLAEVYCTLLIHISQVGPAVRNSKFDQILCGSISLSFISKVIYKNVANCLLTKITKMQILKFSGPDVSTLAVAGPFSKAESLWERSC